MPLPGFITAHWQNLALLSWPIDDSAVTRLLPRGLEIDRFNGDAFVSAVGLTISNLRVLGVPTWPTKFQQVNFRFYVRQRWSSGGCRRGVVFLKQLVPHRTTALTARLLYGEPFARLPMSHDCWEPQACLLDAHRIFAYSWERNGRTEGFWAETDLAAEFPEPSSLTEFLTVRHWGYNGRPGDNTKAYTVTRPAWAVRPATAWRFDCDVSTLLGGAFAHRMSAPPTSVLMTSGCQVKIGWPRRLSSMPATDAEGVS